jgi:hypothetical protein
MKKFLEEHELEVLLLLITMLGVTRWWIPPVWGFENMYGASHWALSYDYGLVRRGLIGAIVKLWMPIMTIEDVRLIALVVYCIFLAFLLIIFYFILRYKDKGGRLFRIILLFVATPATLSLCVRDLGRFDLFLTMIACCCLTLLSLKKHLWLIPVLMVTAMFIHESFLISYAPTIAAALIFVYLWETKDKRILLTTVVATISLAGAFLILFKFGNPSPGYEDFSRLIQSRATFTITELSMRECYYGIRDHVSLASSSLFDKGSIANFFMALMILSPIILILVNLWTHALKNCGAHRMACKLFFIATLSGLILVPIATDYGRWLSAVIFCNFFAIFFLLSKDIIKVEELTEYAGGLFSLLFVLILVTYLLFGPFHDWEPYPYTHNFLYSALSIISVLLFDVGFLVRWRALRRTIQSEE